MKNLNVLAIYNEPVLPKDHPDAAQEYDVLEATAIVVKILTDAGFPVRKLGFSYDPSVLLNEIREHPPDVIFNMFEGLGSQTSTEVSVVGLLEWLNIPFTGSSSLALAVGRDKIRTKYLLQGAGLPTAPFQVVEKGTAPTWSGSWPAIIKPALQDCSVGIEQASVVTDQASLERRVVETLERYGPPVLVEHFVFGRELHVNVVEEMEDGVSKLFCIAPAEIRFENKQESRLWPIYSYEAKWNEQSAEFKDTPIDTVVSLAPMLKDRVNRAAVAAFQLLGLNDFGRVDLRLTDDGTPYILEVNPNPYLHSEGIILGLKQLDRSHEGLIAGMVLNAWQRRKK